MVDDLPQPFDAEHVQDLRDAADMPVPYKATFVGGCHEPNPSDDDLGYETAELNCVTHFNGGVTLFDDNNSDAYIAAQEYADLSEMN